MTLIFIEAALSGSGGFSVSASWPSSDPINPGILENAGSLVIEGWSPTGLEKARADVDALRLTQIYAELARDQWDPERISYQNLPYLAWAMGVNLWEDWWSEPFRRWWVANQWTFKYKRGSLPGIAMAVQAVGGEIRHVIRPPARTYLGPTLSEADHQAYLARFPQLRLYPYAPGPVERYLCFLGAKSWPRDSTGTFQEHNRNGSFLPCYPSDYNGSGVYQRTVVLLQDGVETSLVVRPSKDGNYDEIVFPFSAGYQVYLNRRTRYLLPAHPDRQNKYGLFLGAHDDGLEKMVLAPLDNGKLVLQNSTITPGVKPINITPQMISQVHPTRVSEFYLGQVLARGTALPVSNAWMFVYKLWYLFTAAAVPLNKRASAYLNTARLGIPAYTAELKIAAFGKFGAFYTSTGNARSFVRGFLKPADTSLVDKVLRAVRASEALRDTVLVDTKARRVIQVGDRLPSDGGFYVGQMIDA